MKKGTCFLLWFFGLLIIVVGGCAKVAVLPVSSCRTRVISQALNRGPIFVENDIRRLEEALARSITFLQSLPQEEEIAVCGQQLTVAQLFDGLLDFRKRLLYPGSKGFNAAIWDDFTVCEVLNSQAGPELLATAYYQPQFKASRTRHPPFVYPVYKKPADLCVLKDTIDRQGISRIGRQEKGQVVPYWSRAEIETKGVLAGDELLYFSDPFDLFTLHVQGSGLAELEDGSLVQVLFSGSNGRPYRSIGKLLVDEGWLSMEEISMPRIRRFLQEHLDDRERILHYNERYIFFRELGSNSQSGPVGSMGAPLVPGRSIALDNQCFPMGGLYFMEGMLPEMGADQKAVGWKPFARFVLHQDSGAAIKGSGRLDLFLGSGDGAEAAAGVMKQPARLYMILPKTFGRRMNETF